jgi:hypothetical protein
MIKGKRMKALDEEKKHQNKKSEEHKTINSRRTFIKKAAYAAPTLLIMGSLMRPTETKAGFGPPPSSPNNWP